MQPLASWRRGPRPAKKTKNKTIKKDFKRITGSAGMEVSNESTLYDPRYAVGMGYLGNLSGNPQLWLVLDHIHDYFEIGTSAVCD